ncbi:MAG: D-galactonate dehydratase family protein [Alphaproteobacteria bacterium]|nr:D-galactonate dehydratase family protein [Alphaproteobacteria bacterium]
MKITAIKVIVCSPGRNFVTAKVETDAGAHGVGDGTLNGRELAVAAYLRDHVVPCLIGRDPRRIEDIWHYLYRGAYWRRGPVTMAAIAAIDVALWDIKAKLAGMPLYQLLGGRSRDRVLVYAHGHGADIDEAVDDALRLRERGYRAIRGQCGIPGLARTYGVPVDGKDYEPADAPLPAEHAWNTGRYLEHVPKLFERLRSGLGPEVALLHDVHHRLTPNEAAQLGRALEPFRLFWMEDPAPAENQAAFRRIREMTTTPIAVGEVFNSIHDCHQLIAEQLIDYVRANIGHSGGITHMRRIAHLAELHHVRTGFHGATDLSPVTMGAALHFDLWVPNFGIQEHMPHSAETDVVFPHAYRFADGYMTPGEAPGHGVDIDESLAAKFPYRRAYLPVNRLEDGTLWHW